MKPASENISWKLRAFETALIFGVYFVVAGGEPPGESESHYLAKAKHYWNPEWCRDDLFLNSADAHAVFYWTLGWLTLFFSLPASAWIGRCFVWLLQAWAWQRLSWAILPRRGIAVATAAVYLALVAHGHMAREWAVGGLEAKGLAYALVWLGLEALVRQRWQQVFPLLGASAAFHVVVGGWAVVAAAVAWLILRVAERRDDRPPGLRALAPGVLLGFVLSLPGLAPGLLLNRNLPSGVIDEGHLAYVYARLSHHTVVHRFPASYLVRHGLLVAAAVLLGVATWQIPRLRRVFAFTIGALLIAALGIAIDWSLRNSPPEWSARLLRFYWYRLSDASVPLVVTFSLAAYALAWRSAAERMPRLLGNVLLIALVIAGFIFMSTAPGDRSERRIPTSQRVLRLRGNEPFTLEQRHFQWVDCCQWIRENTDPHASFITPRYQQSFKWYAHRAEVVNWKDAPQDSGSLVAWLRRYEDVYPDPAGRTVMYGPEIDPQLPQEQRLRELGAKYNAEYVVIDRFLDPLPNLRQVYPTGDLQNESFAVFALDGER
jgi:hypothetical protein